MPPFPPAPPFPIANPSSFFFNNSKCVAVQTPPSIEFGKTFTGRVIIQNTGSTSWNSLEPNPYNLGSIYPLGHLTYGVGRVGLPYSPVNFGESTVFTINAQAPAAPPAPKSFWPFSYNFFGWQMVQEWREWFGEECVFPITLSFPHAPLPPPVIPPLPPEPPSPPPPPPVQEQGLASSCAGIHAPERVYAGQPFSSWVMMQNTGQEPWSGNVGLFNLGSSPLGVLTWGLGRVGLPNPVNFGESALFQFNVIAPETIGSHPFAWMMVDEWLTWFGQTCYTFIEVLP